MMIELTVVRSESDETWSVNSDHIVFLAPCGSKHTYVKLANHDKQLEVREPREKILELIRSEKLSMEYDSQRARCNSAKSFEIGCNI